MDDLASGQAGATIRISESGAGSDVMQLRTRAICNADGTWRITGEKCWISYSDQDLTDRLVHCVLARTDTGQDVRPEVSLFLVEGGGSQPGRVAVRRLEEKLGLHGSPTCAIGFEDAGAVLLGERGRGLAQMFVMITQMRLAVGAMGLAIGSASADLAFVYAAERRQGDRPGAPVAIIDHPDVRRQLLEMDSRALLLRDLILATSNIADQAMADHAGEMRENSQALVQFLLPIVKTAGADTAFRNASGAIQVLGGAGYTCDWPAAQMLRDARVLSVFEGTSGIQALDLVHRRVLRDDGGLRHFIALARNVARGEAKASALDGCLDRVEDAVAALRAANIEAGGAEAGASAFLQLAILAALGWMAGRGAEIPGEGPAQKRIRTNSRYWLCHIEARAEALCAEVKTSAAAVRLFQDL